MNLIVARVEVVSLFYEQVYFLYVGIPQWENVVNITFPLYWFCVALVYQFCFYFRHEDVGKCNCHFRTHCGSMGLEVIFSDNLEWILVKDKAKHFFEMVGWIAISMTVQKRCWKNLKMTIAIQMKRFKATQIAKFDCLTVFFIFSSSSLFSSHIILLHYSLHTLFVGVFLH